MIWKIYCVSKMVNAGLEFGPSKVRKPIRIRLLRVLRTTVFASFYPEQKQAPSFSLFFLDPCCAEEQCIEHTLWFRQYRAMSFLHLYSDDFYFRVDPFRCWS